MATPISTNLALVSLPEVAKIAYPRGKTEIHALLWSVVMADTPADMNDRIDALAEQVDIQAIWSVRGAWTGAA
jgi:hypothetical protein